MGIFSKKEKTPEEIKLKELTGGFTLNQEYQEKLKKNNLSINKGIEIQSMLKKEIKNEGLQANQIEERLNYLLQGNFEEATLRKGVSCNIAKQVEGNKGHSGATKALASSSFGMAGWALASGSKMGVHTIEVPSTIAVVPKGVVISSKNEDDLRVPFDQIVKANSPSNKKVIIKLVEGSNINITKCKEYLDIVSLVNKSATGVDESGWE